MLLIRHVSFSLQYCHGYQREHHISAWDVEVHSNQGHNFSQYPFSTETDSSLFSALLCVPLKISTLHPLKICKKLSHCVENGQNSVMTLSLASIWLFIYLSSVALRACLMLFCLLLTCKKGKSGVNYFPLQCFPTLQIASLPSTVLSRKSICARGGTL